MYIVVIRYGFSEDRSQIDVERLSFTLRAICLAVYRSFTFEDKRVDEALRMFLETFRLPGEAPVISYILEGFAEHWQVRAATCCFNQSIIITMVYVKRR